MYVKLKYPTLEETATRVLSTYNEALVCRSCDPTITAQWYQDQNAWIRENKRPEWSMLQATAIYAVMSANASVPLNNKLFLDYVATGTFQHFGDVVRRANLAAYGRVDLALEYSKADMFSLDGKIPSFAHNLMWPNGDCDCKPYGGVGGCDVVTIDRHAADVATYRRRESKNMVGKPKTYNVLAGGYRLAARAIGLRPNSLQAIVWVHHMSCNGGKANLVNTLSKGA